MTVRAARVARDGVGRPFGAGRSLTFPLGESAFTAFLEISVTDSGIGVSGDGLSRLFQPFSQVDTGLARRFEGAGLGLALVKRLAELHDGTVAMESEVNVGSRFVVWLPFRTADEAVIAPLHTGAGRGRADALAGTRTALIVEDDLQAAALIRLRLEAEGFRVLHATSAEAALVIAIRQPLVQQDLRLVDGLMRLRAPCIIGAGIVRIDADDVELVEILEFDVGDALQFAAEHQMKKLLGFGRGWGDVRHGDRSACPRVRVTRGVHP